MCSFVEFLRPTKSCATFFGPPDIAQVLAVWAQIRANKNKQLFGKAWEWLKSVHNHWNAGTINKMVFCGIPLYQLVIIIVVMYIVHVLLVVLHHNPIQLTIYHKHNAKW